MRRKMGWVLLSVLGIAGCEGTQRSFTGSLRSDRDGGAAGAGVAETDAPPTNGSAVNPSSSRDEDLERGTPPLAVALVAAPESLDFGNTEVGTVSSSLRWKVALKEGQISGSRRPILSNTNELEFDVQGDCADLVEGSCELVIQFKPQTGGVRNARLALVIAEVPTVSVLLTGNGQFRLTLVKGGVGRGNVTSTSSDAIACGDRCSALVDAGERVTLDARTLNGTNSFLSAWNGGDCTTPSQRCTVLMNASRSVEAVFSPMLNNLVFVSSGTFSSNLGGTALYDAACNELATAAGINSTANDGYFAGMATTAASLRQRLLATPVPSWVRMDGRPFATDIDALFDAGEVYHPVQFTELGEPISVLVMTGETDAGDISNCRDWSSTASDSTMIAGHSAAGPLSWLISSASGCSEEPLHVLCFGRSGSSAPIVSRQLGKVIWVSDEPYLPGGESPDQHCQRFLPPGVAAAGAVLADTRRSGADTLEPQTRYVRPDGQMVGTGEQLVLRRPLTGIWQLSNGLYLTRELGINAWSGQFETTLAGTAASTCGDWQSTEGSGVGGIATFATAAFWAVSNQPCDQPARLYCIER